MTALSELLTRANVQEWSNREIGRRAELSSGTVDKYMRGDHGDRPTNDVLAKFSSVFNLPIERLREAAGLPTGERKPYHSLLRSPQSLPSPRERARRACTPILIPPPSLKLTATFHRPTHAYHPTQGCVPFVRTNDRIGFDEVG